MAGYTVAHLDEIEEFSDAGCHYRPIRHHLGHHGVRSDCLDRGWAGDASSTSTTRTTPVPIKSSPRRVCVAAWPDGSVSPDSWT